MSSDFRKCGICGEWGWWPTHACPPHFEVREREGDPSDWTTLRARDAEQAAERYVERRDWGQSELSDERDVVVRNGMGQYWAYTVKGETVPVYSAEDGDFDFQKDPEDADEEESEAESEP